MGRLRYRLTGCCILIEKSIHRTTTVGVSWAYVEHVPDLPGFVKIARIAPALIENVMHQCTAAVSYVYAGHMCGICRTHLLPATIAATEVFLVVGVVTVHMVSLCRVHVRGTR